ncbi:hypothetical protein AB6805_30480 [Chitinophaga sp. RCC_12]|uniref:hypothetical protein n=1 Tax=Chitinophaga sp. RCC_12 TaxID=3239226 RepID=UPI00352480AC
MEYYNTNNLTGEALHDATQRAGSQEDIIQKFFNKHRTEKFLVSEVYHRLLEDHKITERTPIWSIRRAISRLKKDGKLDKLPETAIGANAHGSPEHYYQLSTWAPAGYSEQHPIELH